MSGRAKRGGSSTAKRAREEAASFPDFSKVEWRLPATPTTDSVAAELPTPEGIRLKNTFTIGNECVQEPGWKLLFGFLREGEYSCKDPKE